MKNTKIKDDGFTLIEVIISIAVFAMMIIILARGFQSVDALYTRSKHLYEIYTVLSACPEIDRALHYDNITAETNCFPHNTFRAEGGTDAILTYHPEMTVTPTSGLATSDPLYTHNISNAKVVDIKVGYLNSSATPWEIRLLIGRNGIGQ